MADDLRARLESHSKAFEGLMSLIPAKFYYGEDNDDQWQRKKQTKEEKRAAKRAKLDPDAYKSALDVHKDNERKRKRELELDQPGGEVDSSGPLEKPKQGLAESRKSLKKRKLNDKSSEKSAETANDVEPDDEASRQKKKSEKRREKRERKRAKRARKLERAEAAKAKNADDQQVASNSKDAESKSSQEDEHDDATNSNTLERIEFKEEDGEQPDALQSQSSRSPSPALDTPTFSNSLRPSSASSTSSTNPSAEQETAKPTIKPGESTQNQNPPREPISQPDNDTTAETAANKSKTEASSRSSEPYERAPKLPPIDQEVLKERLAARINALRAARKADGLDGKPARNRAELIEARRRKEEARRAHKKDLRTKAKEQDAEAEAARLRGETGSPLWSSPGVFGPIKEPKQENNFAFGRVAFDDGTQVDSGLSGLIDPKKKKGPQDPRSALEAAQRKQSRLDELDEEKRAHAEEKDRWLNARKRVEGEKVRDNTSLLKKTLKRKEKGKDKSEKAWKERTDGIQKSIAARQAKREENLAKRKDEKGGKKRPTGPTKPKKRPGFEGSFKTGARRML